jgi:hypothetical protein
MDKEMLLAEAAARDEADGGGPEEKVGMGLMSAPL